MKGFDSAIESAIYAVGGRRALADHLDVSVQAVSKWVQAGRPPAERVLAIEDAAEGAVTRYELRPDIYGEVRDEPKRVRRAR